jgi:hypothetical protein
MALTLPAETRAVLAKLAALQKRPTSAVAADLLEEMTPALQRVAVLLEAAGKQRSKIPAETAARLNELETVLQQIGTMGLDRLAVAVGQQASFGRQDEAGARRAPLGRRRKPRPPVQ